MYNYGNGDIISKNLEIFGRKKIYFGHQSVGYDIIDGIVDLKSKTGKKVNIIEIEEPIISGEPALYHSRVGKNTDPISKIDDFKRKMDAGIGKTVEIAFLKLCFVDIQLDTDIKKVFEHYKNTMEELKKKYPKMTIIHFTAPLTNASFKTSWKTIIKVILKKKSIWEYDEIVKKNEYNELIRDYFVGKEPIFDIAYLESLLSNKTRSSFKRGGKTYFDLAEKYTYDGGHLNENGRQWIANNLINFIARIQIK